MSLVASFLGGAKSRLLPASVPFTYFTSAAAFHVLAWLVLLISADELPGFRGGPGLVLAALHLLTLGVLVMTAMGAALQLLPVATRRPLASVWPARLSFWLLLFGTLVLTLGMAAGHVKAMYWGGGSVTASLFVFALIMGDNLRRARDLPVVAAHGWAALVALLGFAGLGLVLIADFELGFLANRLSAALTHMLLAGFGFMGMLVLGFSQVLIPMFALSRTLPPRLSWSEFWLALLACAIGAVASFKGSSAALAASATIGLCACAAYISLMRAALRGGMRKRLGLSFVLIKLSWAALALCLAIGLSVLRGDFIHNGAVLFGFMLFVGWLLTFLSGILQRIMPFLASMHAVGEGSKPALISELTSGVPLQIHAACHVGAVLLCGLGIVANVGSLTRAGAGLGLAGAVAFGVFVWLVVVRLAPERRQSAAKTTF